MSQLLKTLLLGLTLAVSVSACQKAEETTTATSEKAEAAEDAITSTNNNADIIGAGSTFGYPIYAKWAQEYNVATGIKVNYQSIGSGGGIKQITNKVVDFGASDKPLTLDALEKAGLMQFPSVLGGVVPVFNLPGIEAGQLKLDSALLSNIFLGKVKKWNDPAIKAINPELALPDKRITVVHRSDGSGTTFLFANYLSKVNETWASDVGADTSVKWPAGVGGKGNEGVASYTKRIKGAIGYVEYAYAKQNKLTHVALKNKAGQFVEPSIEAFQSAAAYAKWKEAPGFYEILTDQLGDTSWPITGATFVLMHKEQASPEHAQGVLKFFDYSFTHGSKSAVALDYVPIPENVIPLIKESWKTQIKSLDGQVIWQ